MDQPNKPSAIGNFIRGFASSAGTGLLMSGIYYGLSIATGHTGGLAIGLYLSSTVLPAVGLMVAAVGIFGGIMAMHRAGKHHLPVNLAQHASRAHTIESPVLVPVIAPTVGLDEVPARTDIKDPQTRRWADRAPQENGDRIAQILTDGSLSDKSRASAILAEREAAAASRPQLG